MARDGAHGGAAPRRAEADGRLRRSERSRAAIVDAMFALVGEGERSPTAERVAERAGVGLRTVFRHFQDMEGLFAAMDARLVARVGPLLEEPDAGGVEARVRAFARSRALLFEAIAPYKRAEALKRWRSRFLAGRHAELVDVLRADLRRWFPEAAGRPREVRDALELVTSFEAWDRLRSEQRLTPPRARAALEHAVRALLGADGR
jgi:AcrR family transcriptional regulator